MVERSNGPRARPAPRRGRGQPRGRPRSSRRRARASFPSLSRVATYRNFRERRRRRESNSGPRGARRRPGPRLRLVFSRLPPAWFAALAPRATAASRESFGRSARRETPRAPSPPETLRPRRGSNPRPKSRQQTRRRQRARRVARRAQARHRVERLGARKPRGGRIRVWSIRRGSERLRGSLLGSLGVSRFFAVARPCDEPQVVHVDLSALGEHRRRDDDVRAPRAGDQDRVEDGPEPRQRNRSLSKLEPAPFFAAFVAVAVAVADAREAPGVREAPRLGNRSRAGGCIF
mmetsp:Transcript_9565/g.39133  ORF Transcript_9565/g.39133 Transcript_9565/m.39133 type:complete len:290 (+) Transcript_9565:2934-3803(+)